jgi:hypothetical protein
VFLVCEVNVTCLKAGSEKVTHILVPSGKELLFILMFSIEFSLSAHTHNMAVPKRRGKNVTLAI